jgi:hypothetical protein
MRRVSAFLLAAGLLAAGPLAAGLLAAGLVLAVAHPAAAAPPSSDPNTAARYAAAWLARQVNDAGFIPQAANPATPNLSVSVQAVPALASARVGGEQVDALLAYLGEHVGDVAAPTGTDDPAALGYLILAAVAGGLDPAAFGTPAIDLVTRLSATQRSDGLFGTADATFDGAFRQGVALLALDAAGVANASGVAWLEDQQCDDGLWTAFRTDTTQPCPPVDPTTFSGPDTNSTALAVLGLQTQGATSPAEVGVAALETVRNNSGGWGFLAAADQPIDANSTGVVLAALRTATGAPDAAATTALLGLQAGCDAPAADRGGIAFQAAPGGALVPDALATVQSIAALAEVPLPVIAPAISDDVPTPCRSAPVTTSGFTGSTPAAPATTSAVADTNAAAGEELPRTGALTGPLAFTGAGVLTLGSACLGASRRRRRG